MGRRLHRATIKLLLGFLVATRPVLLGPIGSATMVNATKGPAPVTRFILIRMSIFFDSDRVIVLANNSRLGPGSFLHRLSLPGLHPLIYCSV